MGDDMGEDVSGRLRNCHTAIGSLSLSHKQLPTPRPSSTACPHTVPDHSTTTTAAAAATATTTKITPSIGSCTRLVPPWAYLPVLKDKAPFTHVALSYESL